MKVSPLAPKNPAVLSPLSGVRIATAQAGIKYDGRTDLLVMVFDQSATAAGVNLSVARGSPITPVEAK